MLTRPNGAPLETVRTTEVSTDQAAAVGAMMIDAQVSWLLRAGVPPNAVIEILMNLAAGILSGLEPADVRRTVVQELTHRFGKVVAERAGKRLLETMARPT